VTVFLDTVGLLALWVKSDQWHQEAQACFSDLISKRANMVTSTFVLLECANATARRPYHPAVCRLRTQMETANRLITPTPHDWKTAWTAYESGEANNSGMVDQISFALMRRLGISSAFTNDGHFGVAGFERLFSA
jgi:predicted nucleic acid-binding protein